MEHHIALLSEPTVYSLYCVFVFTLAEDTRFMTRVERRQVLHDSRGKRDTRRENESWHCINLLSQSFRSVAFF